jgi:HSP20 family protein
MLARWNPFETGRIARSPSQAPGFDDLLRETDNLLQGSFNNLSLLGNWADAVRQAPAVDVVETDKEIQVKMDLPGHDAKTLQVKLEGDMLTVQSERKQESKDERQGYLRAERSYGMFSRSIALPNTVDVQRAEAKYEQGVLTVTLPKREDVKPKTIEIKVDAK